MLCIQGFQIRRTGTIHIGMSLGQLRTVLGEPRAFLEGNAPEVSLEDCAYINSASLPRGLGVMLERGRVVRIDVGEPGIMTASGVGVGATESTVKETYSDRIRVEPHKYDPRGHYLRFVPASTQDRDFGLVFETDGHSVTSFRAGTARAVALVEGCA